jgi:hypothetical protein
VVAGVRGVDAVEPPHDCPPVRVHLARVAGVHDLGNGYGKAGGETSESPQCSACLESSRRPTDNRFASDCAAKCSPETRRIDRSQAHPLAGGRGGELDGRSAKGDERSTFGPGLSTGRQDFIPSARGYRCSVSAMIASALTAVDLHESDFQAVARTRTIPYRGGEPPATRQNGP